MEETCLKPFQVDQPSALQTPASYFLGFVIHL